MSGASYNNGKSEQTVCTPKDFLNAVEERFGQLEYDLACTKENCVGAHGGIGPGNRIIDSLSIDWQEYFCKDTTLWLNPPFGNIPQWAKKCAEMRFLPSWTLLLVPASVGANWWRDYVKDNAMVYYLNGRIKFVGHKDAYPKDLALVAYGFGAAGETIWTWKKKTA